MSFVRYNTDGIILDVDGTLWDSTAEVAIAWNNAVEMAGLSHEPLTGEGLKGLFGKPMNEIVDALFPDASEEEKARFRHFAYEEGQVFPYVEAVLNKQSGARFTIGEYEENHSNVEEKLEDLKNLVMKYIPAQCNQQEAYKVLFYIYSLERDLNKHTFIEDDILVPMVGRMENHE